jgi:hypothetical protein
LARAQQNVHEDRSMFGKMFGMFKSRPPVPTETGAVSSAEDASSVGDTAPAPVRGGTVGAGGGSNGNGNGGANNSFSIDPKGVVKPQPAKKFR